MLNSRNWYSHNYRRITIYSQGICFPKNNHRRLSLTSNWRQNFNYERPPEDTPFLVLWRCKNKKEINQIARILQRSTSQPRLQILPLPPMLPQSQNENIQHQKIISTPAPDLRVEPVFQPPGVKKVFSTHTASNRVAFKIPQLRSTFKSMD